MGREMRDLIKGVVKDHRLVNLKLLLSYKSYLIFISYSQMTINSHTINQYSQQLLLSN